MIRLLRLRARDFKQLQHVDLELPPRASILVQGLNEAGKSTLFEAVYAAMFGAPLEGRGLEDCIRYGSDEARLDLELALSGGRRLGVHRVLRRGRPNIWTAEVRRADGALEELQGNAVVNARVAAELGIDGEALLNTCFVEQKKLAKLEGMGRRQREASLMRLLNLDRMLSLAEELRVTGRDQHHAARLGLRADLSRLQGAEPRALKALARAERTLASSRATAALELADTRREELAAAEVALAAARNREADCAARAAEASRLREAQALLRASRDAAERAAKAELQDDELRREIERARSARDVELPAVLRRGRELDRIARRLRLLDRFEEARREDERWVAEADRRLAGLATLRAEQNEVRRARVAARGAERDAVNAAASLGNDLRAFDVRDALREWIEADQALECLGRPGADVEVLRSRLAEVEGRLKREVLAFASGVAAGLAVGVWLHGAGFWIALLLAAWLGLRSAAAMRYLLSGRSALARSEGEATAAVERATVLERRLRSARERLRELNSIAPSDALRAREVVAELDQQLAWRGREAVAADLEEVRTAKARAVVEAAALAKRDAELDDAAGPIEAQALSAERAAKAGRARRLAEAGERWRVRLEGAARRVGCRLDQDEIAQLLGELRVAVRDARVAAAGLDGLEGRLAELEDEAAALRRAQVGVGAGAVPNDGTGAASSPASAARVAPGVGLGTAQDSWDDAEAELQRSIQALGGDALNDEHRQASAEVARAMSRVDAAQSAARAALEVLQSHLREAGVEVVSSTEALDHAQSAEAYLAMTSKALRRSGPPAVETAAAQRDEAARALAVVRHDRARLESELGLSGERLDPRACMHERDEAARDLQVRAVAAEILEVAGRNAMQRVLPSTLEHMRRVLPMLTDGRYFDVKLADDYTIEVYDDEAGAWRSKVLFSGGAQDQMSLALRLAFALATLPEEHGAAPAFLFLDEPLSAFDDRRAAALIDLVTEGEVARSFDQIFLISHVRVNPSRFDRRIVLEGGRVVETDLPPGYGSG